MHCSASTVRHHVKRFEQCLDVQLVQLDDTGVLSPTPAGAVVVVAAVQMTSCWTELKAHLQQPLSLTAGRSNTRYDSPKVNSPLLV